MNPISLRQNNLHNGHRPSAVSHTMPMNGANLGDASLSIVENDEDRAGMPRARLEFGSFLKPFGSGYQR